MSNKTDKGLESFIDLKYIDPNKASFVKTNGGFIKLINNDEEIERVDVFRLFPLTFLDRYISVRKYEGDEIGIIEDLSTLNSEQSKMITDELNRRYFTPEILSISRIKEEFSYHYWDVETSSGYKQFVTKRGNNLIKVLKNKSILISDIDGNRYQIKDESRIDDKYMKVIEVLI